MEGDVIGRQVVGQHTPGGANAPDVEDGADDFPAVVFDGARPGLVGSSRGSRRRHSVLLRSLQRAVVDLFALGPVTLTNSGHFAYGG